jgi:hypothetical protein
VLYLIARPSAACPQTTAIRLRHAMRDPDTRSEFAGKDLRRRGKITDTRAGLNYVTRKDKKNSDPAPHEEDRPLAH